jgi:hypothetical protein
LYLLPYQSHLPQTTEPRCKPFTPCNHQTIQKFLTRMQPLSLRVPASPPSLPYKSQPPSSTLLTKVASQ